MNSVPPWKLGIVRAKEVRTVDSLRTFSKRFLILSALTLASASFTFAGRGVARGATYYVDGQMSGNCTRDNYSIARRNCTGSDGNAYGTARGLQTVASVVSAGDTVYVRAFAGTYIGDGGEGSNSIRISTDGGLPGSSLTNRLKIFGCPIPICPTNEVPRLFSIEHSINVHWKDFLLDGKNLADGIGIGGIVGNRIENLTVRGYGQHGILGADDSELINLNVHQNGWNCAGWTASPPDGSLCHGIYIGTNNIVDGGRYHHNSGYGIHCYRSCRDTIIRNLRADHNRGAGIIVAFDSGVEVYNVVADNNGTGVWFAADGAIGYNITAYNNSGADIYVSDFSNQTLENSIGLPNGISTVSGTIMSNNISGGSASSYFVDADNANFQLISKSTANNVGANLSVLY
jgi:Right handed beta helix region